MREPPGLRALREEIAMSGEACNLRDQIVRAAIAYCQGEASADLLRDAVDALLVLRSEQFAITKHALERYRSRIAKKQPPDVAAKKIKQMLDRAKEVELKNGWRVIQLINHNFKDARYFKDNQWMLVVVGDAVVTIYKEEAGRWK